MMPNRYRCHGLVVASDLVLHLPPAAPAAQPDMVLRYSPSAVPVWTPQPEALLAAAWVESRQEGYTAARTDDGYRLRFPDLCDFDLSADLRVVTWRMAVGANPGVVAVLAAGALLAFRLVMAGDLVLHASAVEIRGRGLAFVGAPNAGKSTMATLMCAAGATMITDDVARITVDGDAPLIVPGSPESRLRPGASTLVERFDEVDTRITSDGRTAVTLPCSGAEPVPLGAIVIPVPARDRERIVLDLLSPGQALILLGQFPRLPGWIDPTVATRQFEMLADVVNRVPTYVGLTPWRRPFARNKGESLLDCLGWVPIPTSTAT